MKSNKLLLRESSRDRETSKRISIEMAKSVKSGDPVRIQIKGKSIILKRIF